MYCSNRFFITNSDVEFMRSFSAAEPETLTRAVADGSDAKKNVYFIRVSVTSPLSWCGRSQVEFNATQWVLQSVM